MTDLLNAREKTRGDYYDTASTAQALQDAMRRGKNGKILADMQREAVRDLDAAMGDDAPATPVAAYA